MPKLIIEAKGVHRFASRTGGLASLNHGQLGPVTIRRGIHHHTPGACSRHVQNRTATKKVRVLSTQLVHIYIHTGALSSRKHPLSAASGWLSSCLASYDFWRATGVGAGRNHR